MESELVNARVSVILSQIQTHFLYNALNGIEELCYRNIQNASEALEHFVYYLRGYLMKPVRTLQIRAELDNLRNPSQKNSANSVRIQTFGNFEVFREYQPLHIPCTKCKECLSYLVDRKGAFVTAAALSALLWEDRPYYKAVQNNVHRVVSDWVKLLKENGAE